MTTPEPRRFGHFNPPTTIEEVQQWRDQVRADLRHPDPHCGIAWIEQFSHTVDRLLAEQVHKSAMGEPLWGFSAPEPGYPPGQRQNR
jgi:hypothetical protein